MAGEGPQAVMVVDPRGPAGSGPSATRRESKERVHEMVPALVPVAAPMVQPSARLITPVREKVEEEAEEEVEREEVGGGRMNVGAGAAPPPGGLGPRVQRTSLPEMFLMMTQRELPDGGLLVDDDVQTLTSGQLRKRDFLRELRTEVTSAADGELRRVGRSAADCPFIAQVMDRYERRTAAQVERSVRRYAPAARNARDARQYIPAVAERVRESVRRWAETGQVPEDLPDDDMPSLRNAGGLVGAIAAVAGLQPPERGRDQPSSSGEAARDSGGGGAAAPSRKAIGPSPGRVDGAAIVSRLGPGRPLDGGTRSRMEAGFGHSFAAVRIHADDTAADLNRDLSARAFTIGPHVAMGAGAPSPGTVEGDALLAHELAHVLQQGTESPRGHVPIGDAGDAHEHDADEAAAQVVANLHAPSQRRPVRTRRAAGGIRLQRCGNTYTPRTQAQLEQALPMVATIRERWHVAVTEQSANWNATELEAVNAALAVLDDAERAQLTGLSIIRVDVTGRQVGGSGCLGQDAHAVTGVAAQREGGTATGAPIMVKEIRVSNAWSSSDVPGMTRLIVHELGHVIEKTRRAERSHEVNRTADLIDPALTAVRTADRGLADEVSAAQSHRYVSAEISASAAYRQAFGTLIDRYNTLHDLVNESDASLVLQRRPAADAALETALADHEREREALRTAGTGANVLGHYQAAADHLIRAAAALRAYARARADNEQAAVAWRATKVQRGGEEVSARLGAFAALVDAGRIGPLVWRDGPQNPDETYTGIIRRTEGEARFVEEMFAEAFAMWRTDRPQLQSQAPTLVTFFNGGGHLQ